ncbi:energy transducer TonB [Algimonas porphyrae]|nr:TonB family protein [Algimonas porphyrae]
MRRLVPPPLQTVYTARIISAYKSPTMYQSIDDELPDVAQPDEVSRAWRQPVLVAVLLGICLMGGLFMLSLQGGQSAVSVDAEPVSRTAYLKALRESRPALRRARLTDFLNQHPQDGRTGAVRAQLSVLDAVADADWQATLTQAYDPRLPRRQRRDAVMAYQQAWGRYLGARDNEIEAVLTDIDAQPEPEDRPDRDLPSDPDRFAGIPADRLAGGPAYDTRRFEEIYGREAVVFRPSEDLRYPEEADGTVVAPRVRRNVRPRYPRSAERRGIDGMVTLSLNIDARGRVAMVELIDVQAERYAEDFVRAAERAALRTRFHPRMVDGEPVPAAGIRKRYRFEAD